MGVINAPLYVFKRVIAKEREMALESFKKQSWEEFVIAGSIEDVVDTGELIELTPSLVIAEDKEGTDVSNAVLDQLTLTKDDALHYLKIRCKDGAEGKSPYKITFRVDTDQGNRYEIDVVMKVKET